MEQEIQIYIADFRHTVFCSPSKRTQCSLPPRKDELNEQKEEIIMQLFVEGWQQPRVMHGRIVEKHGRINIKWMIQASTPEHVYCKV